MFPVLRPAKLNLYTIPMGQTLSKQVSPIETVETDSEDENGSLNAQTENVVQTPTGARAPPKTNGAVVFANAPAKPERKTATTIADSGTDIPAGKLFKCPQCKLSFGYSYNLARHHRQKHVPQPEMSPQQELDQNQQQETSEPVATAGETQTPQPQKAKQTKKVAKKRTVELESDEWSTADDDKENIAPTSTAKRTNTDPGLANVRSVRPTKVCYRITEEQDIVLAEQHIRELLEAQGTDKPYIYHALAAAETGNGSVLFHICNKCIGINQMLDQIRNYDNQ